MLESKPIVRVNNVILFLMQKNMTCVPIYEQKCENTAQIMHGIDQCYRNCVINLLNTFSFANHYKKSKHHLQK